MADPKPVTDIGIREMGPGSSGLPIAEGARESQKASFGGRIFANNVQMLATAGLGAVALVGGLKSGAFSEVGGVVIDGVKNAVGSVIPGIKEGLQASGPGILDKVAGAAKGVLQGTESGLVQAHIGLENTAQSLVANPQVPMTGLGIAGIVDARASKQHLEKLRDHQFSKEAAKKTAHYGWRMVSDFLKADWPTLLVNNSLRKVQNILRKDQSPAAQVAAAHQIEGDLGRKVAGLMTKYLPWVSLIGGGALAYAGFSGTLGGVINRSLVNVLNPIMGATGAVATANAVSPLASLGITISASMHGLGGALSIARGETKYGQYVLGKQVEAAKYLVIPHLAKEFKGK